MYCGRLYCAWFLCRRLQVGSVGRAACVKPCACIHRRLPSRRPKCLSTHARPRACVHDGGCVCVCLLGASQPSGQDAVTSTIRAFDGSPFFAAPDDRFVTKSDPAFYKTTEFLSTASVRACPRSHTHTYTSTLHPVPTHAEQPALSAPTITSLQPPTPAPVRPSAPTLLPPACSRPCFPLPGRPYWLGPLPLPPPPHPCAGSGRQAWRATPRGGGTRGGCLRARGADGGGHGAPAHCGQARTEDPLHRAGHERPLRPAPLHVVGAAGGLCWGVAAWW